MIRGEVAAAQLQSVTLLDRAVSQVESRVRARSRCARTYAGVDAERSRNSPGDDRRPGDEPHAHARRRHQGVRRRRRPDRGVPTRTAQARASHRPAGSAACRAAEHARRDARRDLARRRRTRRGARARADSRPRPDLRPGADSRARARPGPLARVPDLDAADAAEPVRSPAARWPSYIRRTDNAPTTVIRLRRHARDAARQVWSRLDGRTRTSAETRRARRRGRRPTSDRRVIRRRGRPRPPTARRRPPSSPTGAASRTAARPPRARSRATRMTDRRRRARSSTPRGAARVVVGRVGVGIDQHTGVEHTTEDHAHAPRRALCQERRYRCDRAASSGRRAARSRGRPARRSARASPTGSSRSRSPPPRLRRAAAAGSGTRGGARRLRGRRGRARARRRCGRCRAARGSASSDRMIPSREKSNSGSRSPTSVKMVADRCELAGRNTRPTFVDNTYSSRGRPRSARPSRRSDTPCP